MRWPRLLLAFAAGLSLLSRAPLAADGISAAKAKAAATVNFLLFTDWPTEVPPGKPLRLCILAGTPHERQFEPYAGMRIRKTVLEPKRLDRTLNDIAACHAVFVDTGDPRDLQRVSAAVHGRHVLVVATGEHGIQEGAMIALSLTGGHIAFDINIPAARAAGLTFSSKLLRLARSALQ
jgi:hypothetical protein